MAQEVRLQGRTYSDVPSVRLPDSNGVFHPFTDVSDTTATASDVASGKYFYLADGTKTRGTGTGGGGGRGTVTQDQDGYLVLDDDAPAPSITVEALSVTQNGTYTAPTGKAYSPVTVNVSGGTPWSWMGRNPSKVSTPVNTKVYLKDTPFATWTPTTTATKLTDSTTLSRITLPTTTYDHIVLTKWHTHFEYGSGAEQTYLLKDYYFAGYTYIYGYANNYSNMTAGTNNNVNYSTGNAVHYLFYLNNIGADAAAVGTGAGVYPYAIPGVTVNTTSITPKTPQINAKVATAYWSTTNAGAVDQDTSYYEYTIEVWQVDGGTSDSGARQGIIYDMWHNGF